MSSGFQLWRLKTLKIYCLIQNVTLKRYTWLVGNYSDWVKRSKQYQKLVHTCSLVSSPGAEFVRLVKRVRNLNTPTPKGSTCGLTFPPLPFFNNFTKKSLLTKSMQGYPLVNWLTKRAGVSPTNWIGQLWIRLEKVK